MKIASILADRAVVLLLGVGVGTMIGLAFAPVPVVVQGSGQGSAQVTRVLAPAPTRPADLVAVDVARARQDDRVWSGVRRTVAADRPVKVGVFGDSYGDGVYAGLDQQLGGKDGFDVVKYSHVASGFTRYKTLNLEKDAKDKLGDAPLDVAVISFGANDTQGIIDDQGHYAALMSPGWQAQIAARLERFVAVLRGHGALVYWVGLPAMREGKFDADVHAINDFYAARMAALGVPFTDTRPLAAGPDGGFAPYLNDPETGKKVLMRGPDGIHMTFKGYVTITRPVADRIRGYVAAARAASPRKARA